MVVKRYFFVVYIVFFVWVWYNYYVCNFISRNVFFSQKKGGLKMTISNFFNILYKWGFLGKYLFSGDVESRVVDTRQVFSIVMIALAGIGILAAGYLLGSLNFSIIISAKAYKQDIRNYGSNNAGMTNMMRTYGSKAAGLTLLGDALKAVVACLIGYAVFGQMGAYLAGSACVVGHIFPVFFGFKGGKGVVTAGVTMLMCNPFVFLIIVTMFLIIVACTRYISLGAVMSMLLYPFVLAGIDSWLLKFKYEEELVSGSPYAIFALLIAVLIIYKHKENIKRLMAGKESKFSFKKSVKTNKEEK